jgi:hypothetical protein
LTAAKCAWIAAAMRVHRACPSPFPCGGRPRGLEHDPEKWIPVFGKDHAPTKG